MEFKNTKLIVFLRTFSKEELNDFEKFLSFPYFKKDRDLLPYFSVLKKFHPDFSHEDFKEEHIFNMLFPGRLYSNISSKNSFRALSSYMMNAVEEYLFISGIKNNKVLKNRIILKELIDRNIPKYFEQYLNKSYSDLKSDEDREGQDNLERFYLERLSSRHFASVLDFKNYFSHSAKSVESISVYFFLDLLRTAKTKLLAERFRNIKPDMSFISGILETINMDRILRLYEGEDEYFYLCFHYYTYKCLLENINIEYYDKAKNIFFENKSLLSRYDKNFFYSDLINILISGKEKQNTEIRKELLLLFKLCLEDRAYKISDKDFMQPDFYRNVLIYVNYLKEFDWGMTFVNKYSYELKPEYRENMKYFSMAIIYFGKNEFEKSLESISLVKYDLVHFKIDVKILMLKIFYELKLVEQALSLTDTFKHFIKNIKEMPDEVKLSYNNFLKYYTLLLRQSFTENSDMISHIENELKINKNVFHSDWLIDKISKLKLK